MQLLIQFLSFNNLIIIFKISDDNNSNLIIGDINNKAYIDYIKPEDVDPNNIIDS